MQFYRQKPLLNFIVDFYCHAAKLVVELDGWHHAEVEQFAYDDERTIQLNGLGIKVMRFSNQRIFAELPGVVTEIQQQLLLRIQRGCDDPLVHPT